MNIDEYLNNLQNNLDDQLSRFGVSDQPAGNMFSATEAEEKKFCPECGNKVAAEAKFCPECGYKFDAADEAAENSDEQEHAAPAKRKFKVSFACRPYCVQMFKADDELKRRCLEAAANEELSEFWGDYAYNEGDCCFDYEHEVLTWDSQMDFSVYDEDDNEIYHTDDMKDFDLWGERDEDGEFTDFEGMPDGDYFIGFDVMKGSCWEGTFEAEEFDPKKLSFERSKELDDEFPMIGDDVMEVSCLRYDGEEIDLEFQSDNGSYGWTGYLYNCKEKDWWEEITPDDDDEEENPDEEETVDHTDSDEANDSKELDDLFHKIEELHDTYIEKARERVEELFNIAAEKHEQDFGWMSDEVPDSDEDEEAYEDFEESQFHVIRYDDFAYQTGEIIGVRFRFENDDIVITAYYDDDDGEIVEDCDIYLDYRGADNYRAVAFCIEVAERELGLK